MWNSAAHRNIPAELEGYISWGLWVHADDVVKEGVPALMDVVANVGKACTTSDVNALDFMKPAHTESLTAHVECLQVAQVRLGRGPCLGRIEQHWHNKGHVQVQLTTSSS